MIGRPGAGPAWRPNHGGSHKVADLAGSTRQNPPSSAQLALESSRPCPIPLAAQRHLDRPRAESRPMRVDVPDAVAERRMSTSQGTRDGTIPSRDSWPEPVPHTEAAPH